ncbi:MAG: hypothetical protein IJS49_06085 [Paludibacteraceae bacterium]|nr:hypothetical protein [Paludibacteraceae bacterium]
MTKPTLDLSFLHCAPDDLLRCGLLTFDSRKVVPMADTVQRFFSATGKQM